MEGRIGLADPVESCLTETDRWYGGHENRNKIWPGHLAERNHFFPPAASPFLFHRGWLQKSQKSSWKLARWVSFRTAFKERNAAARYGKTDRAEGNNVTSERAASQFQ